MDHVASECRVLGKVDFFVVPHLRAIVSSLECSAPSFFPGLRETNCLNVKEVYQFMLEVRCDEEDFLEKCRKHGLFVQNGWRTEFVETVLQDLQLLRNVRFVTDPDTSAIVFDRILALIEGSL